MNIDFELNEIDLSDKPDEFVELSPTGKVPMIVEDDFVLYESQIINDYLVERHGWEQAYAEDLRGEYRQKVAMKQWDNVILEPVYISLSDSDTLDDNWDDMSNELDYLGDVLDRTGASTDSLFAFHFAPFWARFRWLDDYTSFPDRMDEFPEVKSWLNKSLEESPIAETLPNRDWALKQYEKNYVE